MIHINIFSVDISPYTLIVYNTQNLNVRFMLSFFRKGINLFKDVISESLISAIATNNFPILRMVLVQTIQVKLVLNVDIIR